MCCLAQGTGQPECVGLINPATIPFSFSQEKAMGYEPQKYLRLESKAESEEKHDKRENS